MKKDFAYKIPLDPTKEQERLFWVNAHASRWAFNWALGIIKDIHDQRNNLVMTFVREKHPGYDDLDKDMQTSVRKDARKACKEDLKPLKIPSVSDISSAFSEVNGLSRKGEPKSSPILDLVTFDPDPIPENLDEVARCNLTHAFKDALGAYKRFLDPSLPAKFPRFKGRKDSRRSFYVDNNYSSLHDSRHMYILGKKKGLVRLNSDARRMMRRRKYMSGFAADLKTGYVKHASTTVSYVGGRWYATITLQETLPDPVLTKNQRGNKVGLDANVGDNIVADSNGKIIANPKHFAKKRAYIDRLQKKTASQYEAWKKAGNSGAPTSKRYLKNKAALAKAHRKLAEHRNGNLHEISAEYVKNNEEIVVEKINWSHLSRSAKGTVEEPGKNVKQKSGLNRSILDAGHGELQRQLEYKSDWNSVNFQKTDPKNTSRGCRVCGTINEELTLKDRVFECKNCGHIEHRDIHAARNILARGIGSVKVVSHMVEQC